MFSQLYCENPGQFSIILLDLYRPQSLQIYFQKTAGSLWGVSGKVATADDTLIMKWPDLTGGAKTRIINNHQTNNNKTPTGSSTEHQKWHCLAAKPSSCLYEQLRDRHWRIRITGILDYSTTGDYKAMHQSDETQTVLWCSTRTAWQIN